MIAIEEINALELFCPNAKCGAVVLTATATSTFVHQGRYWLEDGDGICGLEEQLSQEQRLDKGWNTDLMVGYCQECDEQYVVIEARFIDAQPDEKWQNIYFHLNGEIGQEYNRLVRLVDIVDDTGYLPDKWLLQSHNTPLGRVHTHVFGPFIPAGESPFSPICRENDEHLPEWVRACYILLFLWEDMKKLAVKEKNLVHQEMPKNNDSYED